MCAHPCPQLWAKNGICVLRRIRVSVQPQANNSRTRVSIEYHVTANAVFYGSSFVALTWGSPRDLLEAHLDDENQDQDSLPSALTDVTVPEKSELPLCRPSQLVVSSHIC